MNRLTADQLNETLAAPGGIVQVTTYTRSTVYDGRHHGCFFEKNGSLFIRRGKRTEQLSFGDRLLVGIRRGRKAC